MENQSCAVKPNVYDKTGKEVFSPLYDDLKLLLGNGFEFTENNTTKRITPDNVYRKLMNPDDRTFYNKLVERGVSFTEYGTKDGSMMEPSIYDVLKYVDDVRIPFESKFGKDKGYRDFFWDKYDLKKPKTLVEQCAIINDFNTSQWGLDWVAVPGYQDGHSGLGFLNKNNISVNFSERLAFASFVEYFAKSEYQFANLNEAFENYCMNILSKEGYYRELVNKLYAIVDFFENNNGSGLLGETEVDFLLELVGTSFSERMAPGTELRKQLMKTLWDGVSKKQSRNKLDPVVNAINEMKKLFSDITTLQLLDEFNNAALTTKALKYNIFIKDLRNGIFKNIPDKMASVVIDAFQKSKINKVKSIWEKIYKLNLERARINRTRIKKSPGLEEPYQMVGDKKVTMSQRSKDDRLYYRAAYDFANARLAKKKMKDLEDPTIGNGEKFTEDNIRIETIIQAIETAKKDLTQCKEILMGFIENKGLKDLNSRCFDLNIVLDTLRAYQKFTDNNQELIEYVNRQGISDILALALYDSKDTRFFSELELGIDESTATVEEKAKAAEAMIQKIIAEELGNIRNAVESMLKYEPAMISNYGSRSGVSKNNITFWDVAVPMHVEMLKSVCPDGIVYDRYGEVLTLNEAQVIFNDDFSFFNRFLSSLANTPENIMKLYDQVVKKAQDKQRIEFNEVKSILTAAKEKLRKNEKFQFGKRKDPFMFQTNVCYKWKTQKGGIIDKNSYAELIQSGKAKREDFELVNALKIVGGHLCYIQDVIWDKYIDEYKNECRKIKSSQEYQSKESELEREEYFNSKIDEWKKEHTEKDRLGTEWPKLEYYSTEEYNYLTDAQKEYYDTVIGVKIRLDGYIGPNNYKKAYEAVSVRQSGMKRFSTTKGVDFEVKQSPHEVRDFNNNTIHTIARRFDDVLDLEEKDYINENNLDLAQVSRVFKKYGGCVASNILVYADTALKYKHIGGICNEMDLASEMFRTREIYDTKQGKMLMKSLFDGRNRFEDPYTSPAFKKYGERFDKFVRSQVYGKYYDDERGSAMKYSRMLQLFISISTLGFNVIAGINNVITGQHAINTEAISHQDFSIKNMIKAQAFYFSHLLDYILEYGTDTPKSTLRLYLEKFNVLQNYEERLQELRFGRNNFLKELFSISTLFILNNIGEHYLNTVPFLALLDAQEFERLDGKKVSGMKLYKKQWIDPKNHSLGAKLVLREYTYTDENGEKVTTNKYIQTKTESKPEKVHETYLKKRKNVTTKNIIIPIEELEKRASEQNKDKYNDSLISNGEIAEWDFIHRLTRHSAKINQDMHGIYTTDDLNYVQHKIFGRLMMIYRKFIPPSMHRRFGQRQFDYDLERETNGFFNPIVNVAKNGYVFLNNKIKKKQNPYYDVFTALDKDAWNTLSRAVFDSGMLFIWNHLINYLEYNGWDDDESSWFKQMTLLLMYRQRAEIAMFNPMSLVVGRAIGRPINPLQDWLNILSSPIVGMSKVEDWIEMFMAIQTPDAYKVPFENYSTMTKRDFEKLPKYAQIQILYGKHTYEDEKITAEIWNEMSTEDRKVILQDLHSPSYAGHEIMKVIPTIKPLMSFTKPADQLNFYQSDIVSRVVLKRRNPKWSSLKAEQQSILKNDYGFTSTTFNELPSTVRRSIIAAMVEGYEIPTYESLKEAEEILNEQEED